MKAVTAEEYLNHFKIHLSDGKLTQESRYGLCSLIRRMIRANRFLTKHELHDKFRSVLSPVAAVEEDHFFDDCLNHLCQLGDITLLHREEKRSIYMLTLPRWIRLSDKHAVLLGDIHDLPFDIAPIDGCDLLHRFIIEPKSLDALKSLGITESPRPEFPVFPDWSQAKRELELEEFQQKDIPMLILTGKAGDFWGSANFEQPSGRWRRFHDKITDGIYFGCHQLNTFSSQKSCFILQKIGDHVRFKTLADWDNLLALCWSRTLADGQSQVIHLSEHTVTFSMPLPTKWKTMLYYVASCQDRWGKKWKFVDIALWNHYKHYFIH